MANYDIYCEFDIETHKKTFQNYLEVLVKEDGRVVYAVPSHKMKAEELACEKLGISRQALIESCPPEYHWNYLTWLLNHSGAVAVWDEFYKTGDRGLNNKQRATLKKLKMHGLYKGAIGG